MTEEKAGFAAFSLTWQGGFIRLCYNKKAPSTLRVNGAVCSVIKC
jgi:hypothetical protein